MIVLLAGALFVFAHALADYPLQGQFMAGMKHPNNRSDVFWWLVLGMHCAIQAGFVMLIVLFLTLSLPWALYLAALEFVLHFLVDYSKCRSRLSFLADQGWHVAHKLIYVALLFLNGALYGTKDQTQAPYPAATEQEGNPIHRTEGVVLPEHPDGGASPGRVGGLQHFGEPGQNYDVPWDSRRYRISSADGTVVVLGGEAPYSGRP